MASNCKCVQNVKRKKHRPTTTCNEKNTSLLFDNFPGFHGPSGCLTKPPGLASGSTALVHPQSNSVSNVAFKRCDPSSWMASNSCLGIVVIDFCCFPFLLDFPSVNRSKFIEHAIEFVGHDVCWIVALCGIWGHIEAKAHRHTQQTIATKPLDSPSAIDYCATFT